MNIFHILERVVWLINKRRARKVLVDCLDFKILSKPMSENFNLLVQGPVTDTSQNFFIELIGAYKNVFGEERIKVACSAITDEACEYLQKHNIRWVKCSVDEPGPGNLFYQAESVLKGLEICESDIVVKVRNDQFIQRWDFIDANKDEISNNKLFVCGYTLVNPVFHVADMVHYGSKNTLHKIWANLSNSESIQNLLKKYHCRGRVVVDENVYEQYQKIPPEVLLGLSVASHYGCSDGSLRGYLKVMASNLICSSNMDIGLQWAKHNSVLDFHRAWTHEYRDAINYQKWLRLKNEYLKLNKCFD